MGKPRLNPPASKEPHPSRKYKSPECSSGFPFRVTRRAFCPGGKESWSLGISETTLASIFLALEAASSLWVFSAKERALR